MNKLLLLAIAALLTCGLHLSLRAQDEVTTIAPMTKGTIFLSCGFGPATNWAGFYRGFSPSVMAAVDAGLWELGPGVLTIGGEVGWDYSSYKHWEVDQNYKESFMSITIAARSTYHYGWNIKRFDTYGGVALGGRIPIYHEGTYHQPGFGLGGGVFVGASYFFTPVLGVNAELGYNITYAQAGIVYILKE